MSSISVDYDVLNQKGSPAWYSDTFANIPTPGYKGRMFISTDTFAFYRDNGTGWDLVGGPGTGTITGAGVSGQVTYFIGTDTIGGNNNLFYDITNSRLGIGTATPGAPLDIHTTGTAAQFNGTGVNNSFVLFQNAGSSKWRIGNLYNSGANDYQIFDVTNSTARLTIKNTGASTLIGTFTATSLIKSGGTNLQILLADGSTTPTSTFGAGSVTSVSALTLGTTGTDLTSSVVNSTTTPVITLNVPTASATNRGALSSADWTTFNNKQATLSLTTTGTSGAATLVGATLNIPNYTNVGTVTSVAALTLGTTGTDLSSSVANSTSTPVITLNVPTASATNRGALSSADFTTFNNKQATISVTAPVVLTGATISMPAATTSVNGYLTSTDWNTFNNKTSNLGTVTDVVALTIGTTGIDITSTAVTTTTTPVITLNIPTASATNRGALSSTDWTTFNNKQATLSLTTTGTSGAATLVANTLNVPNYGSALSGYLPLTGGTLTGALNLTYATPYIYLNGSTGNQTNLVFNINSVTKGNIVIDSSFFQLTNFTSGGWLFKNSVGSNVLTIADSGNTTFTNITTFNSYIFTDNSILIKTGFNTSTSGYTGIGAVATGLTINLGTGTTGSLLFNTGASYSYTFPSATGTLALTSDLGGYLPLTGGTLTGALFGTSATFSGNLNLQNGATRNINFYDSSNTNINAQIQYDQISANSGQLFFGTNNAGTFSTKLSISNTGAATFSSSLSAVSGLFKGVGAGVFNAQLTLENTTSASALIVFLNTANGFSFGFSSVGTGGQRFSFFNGAPTEIAYITSAGAGVFSSSLTATSGLFSSTLQTNATFTVGNQFVSGNYILQVTPSTTTPIQLQGILAGTGTAPIVLQPSGDNVGIGTISPSYKLQVQSASGTIARITDGTNNLDFYAGSSLNEIAATTRLLLSTNGVSRININSGGNTGIGVQPNVWRSSEVSLEIGSTTCLYNVFGITILGNNYYTDASSQSIYRTTGYASYVWQNSSDGSHSWNTAPSGTAGNVVTFTERLSLTNAGIFNAKSRVNTNNSTDNSLFSLSNNGTTNTVGLSVTATASSTNTLTLTTATTTWIYTGTGTASWTLPNPSGTNQMFWIKNAGTGIITLNAFAGTNIINNAAASVSSITIAVGATALIQQDGNVKSYQLQ